MSNPNSGFVELYEGLRQVLGEMPLVDVHEHNGLAHTQSPVVHVASGGFDETSFDVHVPFFHRGRGGPAGPTG